MTPARCRLRITHLKGIEVCLWRNRVSFKDLLIVLALVAVAWATGIAGVFGPCDTSRPPELGDAYHCE